MARLFSYWKQFFIGMKRSSLKETASRIIFQNFVVTFLVELAPGHNVVKLFMVVNYKFLHYVGVFVLDRPFQLTLMFAGKAWRLPE
jgi:hypothetical protein